MKKGLLIWKALFRDKNIGDYIQSLAAEQYTGREVVYVEREETHEYGGEPIQMIMNGWFMHQPENWPPSEKIEPLFVSFHMNPAIGERMLSEKAVDYFKKYVVKYGPVGARDKGTEKLLRSKGIDTYFSGCLTLTLGKTYKHNPAIENICFVDAHHEWKLKKSPLALMNYYFTFATNRKTISEIAKRLYKSNSFKDLLRAAQFYQTYSEYFKDEVLEKAEYIKHMVLESTLGDEKSKLDHARNLMTKYANSRLIVTSRIHAALPCLAIGTPVILVLSDDLRPNGQGLQPKAKGRFEGILDLFHVMENVNFKLKPILGFNPNKKIGVNHSIRNKQNHIKMAEELDKCCTAFINNINHGVLYINEVKAKTL